MNYRETVDFIFGHTNYEMVPRVPHNNETYDLRRVFEVLSFLDNPHLKAKSLHITGTNGKGSTAAMLDSVLTAAGFTSGLYTSPHLLTMRERFKVGGKMISEEEVADLTTRIRAEIEIVNAKAAYGRLTVFEILTVLCFEWFAEKKCQWQVMEVGMGGRFDATNVIKPEVCFLTSISYDHMEVLGDTLTKIATEKCGIIKPGCAVVSHPQAEEADKIIEKTCLEKGARLVRVGKDVVRRSLAHDFEHQEMEIRGRLNSYRVSVPLLGEYQLDNAAAAVAGLELLQERGLKISNEDISAGLKGVSFPGRMQIVNRKPFILVDGGHNPGAARNLKQALGGYFQNRKSCLIIGVSNDKDLSGIARELAPGFQLVIATSANNPRSIEPELIAAEFAKYGAAIRVSSNIGEAIRWAKTLASEEDLICVTGSLFVVGEALGYIKELPTEH
jgi:dihydrofolate synthase / folylpolyglutamate synthase